MAVAIVPRRPAGRLQSRDIQVLKNTSEMGNRELIPKVRSRKWKPGLHVILVQNRYGDGPFLMDWRPIDSYEEGNTRDWNVIVEVKEVSS